MELDFFQKETVSSKRILYTPSEFARTSLIYLQETGSLRACQPHESHRSGLDSYLFFTVVSGSGELMYEGARHRLCPGDCVFINCRRAYSHITYDDLWTLRWVHFSGVNMPEIYAKYISRGGNAVLHPEDMDGVNGLLGEIYSIADSDDYIRDMKLNEKLCGLLTLIMSASWNPDKAGRAKKRSELQSVKAWIDEHYREKISLEELSGMFYIDKFYLMKSFKEQYGTTINSYVASRRITVAKQLLRFTDDSIEHIGAEVSISDANYFIRLFKRIEGMTPGQFRKKW